MLCRHNNASKASQIRVIIFLCFYLIVGCNKSDDSWHTEYDGLWIFDGSGQRVKVSDGKVDRFTIDHAPYVIKHVKSEFKILRDRSMDNEKVTAEPIEWGYRIVIHNQSEYPAKVTIGYRVFDSDSFAVTELIEFHETLDPGQVKTIQGSAYIEKSNAHRMHHGETYLALDSRP